MCLVFLFVFEIQRPTLRLHPLVTESRLRALGELASQDKRWAVTKYLHSCGVGPSSVPYHLCGPEPVTSLVLGLSLLICK